MMVVYGGVTSSIYDTGIMSKKYTKKINYEGSLNYEFLTRAIKVS